MRYAVRPFARRRGRWRYVDNLSRSDVALVDQRSPQNITAFEPQSNEVSCVLLLDTTGSMLFALPALKDAALRVKGPRGLRVRARERY